MSSPEVSIRQYTVEHSLRNPDGQGLIGCMDRRLVTPNDPVLGGDRLFQQVRGGRYGVGHGLALALEVKEPGFYVDLGLSVADFAQALGGVLQMAGILTTKHGPTCGGIEGATVIHDGVASGGEDAKMYQNAAGLYPDLAESQYLRVAEAAKRISAAGLASTPAQIKSVLTTPSAVIPQLSIPHVTPHIELAETDHDEISFVADYRMSVALDRAAAHADGRGAYYSSFGAFKEILDATPSAISERISVEDWWATEAVVLGRVATYDITHEGVPYPIEAIGA
jgi:hypothetical protein